MAENVELDATELAKIFRDFEDGGHRVRDLYPTIGQMLVGAVEEEFDTEGHGKWAPLAESTLANRRREGRGAKILQDTDIFAGSISPAYEGDDVLAYTNVPYARYHTSDEPRTKIPYRNPFDIDEERVLNEVCELVLRSLP